MMMTEATISNYKGIKDCHVKDLRRVNLFIGKNDSGKSSILEAMFHTCREFVEPNLNKVMLRRTNVFTAGQELWYRYDTESKITASLRFGETIIGLTVQMAGAQIQTTLDVAGTRITGSIYGKRNFDLVGRTKNLLDKLVSDLSSERKRKELATYVRNVVFIDCRSKLNLSNLESRLGQIKLKGKDEEMGIILDNTYGKGKEWEFLPHPEAPEEKRIAVKEGGRRIFLSDFGDGFRYALAICATAMTVEGTAIFIEEIENHQHSGSLSKLIHNLVETARQNDLQLFISTHNKDVWNSFARDVYVDDVKREKEEFRCFIVERDVDSGKVTAEHTDDLQRITRELGRT